MPANSLASIRHIVVLMLENRSFDNLLGWQYGLSESDSNRYNYPPPDGPSTTVQSWNNAGFDWNTMTIPDPDPGESFAEMSQQIWGLTEPLPPGLIPTSPGPLGPMGGFAQDYLTIDGVSTVTVKNIMHAFRPEQVKALSTLASAFVAVETYFASAPCQTLPNRCFAQLGTADGYINNETTHPDGITTINAPYFGATIFNQISAASGLDWRVYFGDFPLTLAMADVWKYTFKKFRWLVDFEDDVKNGDLPAYTWIEPSYLAAPTDMHPPHNVLMGDALVAGIYNTLRQSPLWESTLLIVTFDEHGGCYDRIFPGKATPPGGPYRDGYTFNKYGVRVPTVLCSPYIPQTRTGTSGPVYDHTSILSTVRSAFNVQGGPLSDRERTANSLGDFLTLSPPNLNPGPESVSALPPGTAPPVAPKLTALQRVVAKTANLVPEPERTGQAVAALRANQMDKSTNEIRDFETANQMVREAAQRLFPAPRNPGN
jgi:phospholipase C